MLTAAKRTGGHYEVQELDFGRVYRWCPERVDIECECGERLDVTASPRPPASGAGRATRLRSKQRQPLVFRRTKHFIPGAMMPGILKTPVYLAEPADGANRGERSRTPRCAR